MGNCISDALWQDKAAERISATIDHQLEEDSRELRKVCKILLLGPSDTGKTTIIKQMRAVHQNGFSNEECLSYRPIIYRNTLDSAQTMVLAMRKIGLNCINPTNRVNANRIFDYRIDPSPSFVFSPEVAQAIHQLWKDPIIPTLMDRCSEFHLIDSAVYFFTEVLRIGSPNYLPTLDDVLRARLKTTGIAETRFTMGQLRIHIFDAGGQRSERKKWIHCFESVTSIVFCAALSEYNQVLLEEKDRNRMTESLALFESVVNSPWFSRTFIILFLNKIDVFKTKLPKVPLQRYFPDYTGGSDINKAAKYILWRFMETNRAHLSVYPHLIQATDTANIRLVFAAMKDTIQHNLLKDSGIL